MYASELSITMRGCSFGRSVGCDFVNASIIEQLKILLRSCVIDRVVDVYDVEEMKRNMKRSTVS